MLRASRDPRGSLKALAEEKASRCSATGSRIRYTANGYEALAAAPSA